MSSLTNFGSFPRSMILLNQKTIEGKKTITFSTFFCNDILKGFTYRKEKLVFYKLVSTFSHYKEVMTYCHYVVYKHIYPCTTHYTKHL